MGDQRYEVSVIICVKNGRGTIGRQLDALAAQAGAPGFEVVVVDNRSDDGTARYVSQWAREQGLGAIAHLTIVPALARQLILYARNVGVVSARGDLLLFCDADDEVRPTWVSEHYRHRHEHDAAGGRILGRRANGVEVPQAFPDGLIETGYLPHAGGANFAVHRDVCLAVGGYDESLPRYGFEDVDFSWRVQEAGYRLGYVPTAVVDFSLAEASASVRKRFLLGKGRVLMAHRYLAMTVRRTPLPRGFGTSQRSRGPASVEDAQACGARPGTASLRPGAWWASSGTGCVATPSATSCTATEPCAHRSGAGARRCRRRRGGAPTSSQRPRSEQAEA